MSYTKLVKWYNDVTEIDPRIGHILALFRK